MRRIRFSAILLAAVSAGLASWALNDESRAEDGAARVAAQPSFAGTIAFASKHAKGWRIEAMSAAGGPRVRLFGAPGSADALEPVWSPGGRRIAFTRNRKAQRGFVSEIWVMRADGSRARSVTHPRRFGAFETSASWAPGGGRLAVRVEEMIGLGTSRGSRIYLMRSDGTRRVKLPGSTRLPGGGRSDRYDPDWSPDGDRIAFSENPDERSFGAEIFVSGLDGSGLTRLTNDSADDFEPDWSPDGSRLVFSRMLDDETSAIIRINADGTDQRQLATMRHARDSEDQPRLSPTWSPDGRAIVFAKPVSSHASALFVVGADGGAEVRVTPAGGIVCCPSWTARTPELR